MNRYIKIPEKVLSVIITIGIVLFIMLIAYMLVNGDFKGIKYKY